MGSKPDGWITYPDHYDLGTINYLLHFDQFMSNTAACALLAPVGVAISQQLGASPKAVLMAIGVAASCAFATPVGTPPCTLVLGPGGYKFMDYVKVGVPLVVLCFIVSIIVIPMVWPFFPG